MTGSSEEYGERVYQARVTGKLPGGDLAICYFKTPDAAKAYLEELVTDELDLRVTEWRREQSADEKWSMGLVPSSRRAVVTGLNVYQTADGPKRVLTDGGREQGTVSQTECPRCEGILSKTGNPTPGNQPEKRCKDCGWRNVDLGGLEVGR